MTRFMSQQRLSPDQRLAVQPRDDHIPEAERGRVRHRQPVGGPDQEAVTTAGEPRLAGHRDCDSGQGGSVDQVRHEPDAVPGTHAQDPSGDSGAGMVATLSGTRTSREIVGSRSGSRLWSRCATAAPA